MSFIYFLELTGTIVFAMSGFLVAGEKRFDLFGALVVAFVTSIGGGTLRDVMIGSTPVGWMQDIWYATMIGLGVLIAWIMGPRIRRLQKTMFLFDTIGIGLFTILGLQKTLEFGLHPVIAIMMGTVSAVFGGVVRDVLVNREPLVFRQELYATACLMGGLLYVILDFINLPQELVMLITALFIMAIRTLAVLRGWYLPKVKHHEDAQ